MALLATPCHSPACSGRSFDSCHSASGGGCSVQSLECYNPSGRDLALNYIDSLMAHDSTKIQSSRSFLSSSNFSGRWEDHEDLCDHLEGCGLEGVDKEMRAWRVVAGELELDGSAPVPKPGKGEVLVKIMHASVNPIDWKLMGGGTPLFRAKEPYTPGFDFSGVIEGVGPGTDIEVGERVIGYLGLMETCSVEGGEGGLAGSFAEYCCIPSSRVAVIPGYSDPRALAGLPLAGLTAYQALFTGSGGRSLQGGPLGSLKKGQKVLVLGGSTGTGCFGVQLAKAVGARVTATASDAKMPACGKQTKMDWVKSLGADRVINYRMQDWGEDLAGQEFDMIFDCVGDDSDVAKAEKVLKSGAPFVSIANFAPTIPKDCKTKFANFIVAANGDDLSELVTLTELNKLIVPVDSTYPLEKLQDALERSRTSRAAGKIIIDVAPLL